MIWVVAFEALALIGLPTGPLVMLKASLFPFAAIGVYRRGWFVTTAVLASRQLPSALSDALVAHDRCQLGCLTALLESQDVPPLLPIAAWLQPRQAGAHLTAPGIQPAAIARDLREHRTGTARPAAVRAGPRPGPSSGRRRAWTGSWPARAGVSAGMRLVREEPGDRGGEHQRAGRAAGPTGQ
ncbi:MAG: hypothetical protein U0838_04860 [Chloroflexota bacterium]